MSTTRPPAYDQAGPVEASRRGAHRARAKPALAGLPILAGILIVVAAVGGAWYVLGDAATKDSSSPSVEAAVGGDEPTGTVPASAGAAGSTTATPPSAEASTEPSAPESTGGTDGGGTAPVNRDIRLRVLNSVSVQGLAARVADNLKPDGWTVSATGNSIQKNLATTKVYYGSKAAKPTAQALVKDLGFGEVVADQSVAKNGLVVVLGQDAV